MPDADDPRALAKVALGDLQRELDATERMLKRIPTDRLSWKPHEKSWTVGELGAHVANLLSWAKMTIEDEGYDLAADTEERKPPEKTEQILETFYGLKGDVEDALRSADDEALLQPWTLWHGEQEVFSMPKVAALRTWSISHMIHHRGQLSVYLRMLDVPVPPTYGPTADESP